jgi:hypothetical protein
MLAAKTSTVLYTGGCHCGAVRFQIRLPSLKAEEKYQVIDCNCSICRQKGFLHLIVPPADFTLLQGAEALTSYRFNTGIAEHLFCKICGIHSFYHPRSHPHDYDVNLNCLDSENVDIREHDIREYCQVVPFDGQDWEANISQLR